MSNNWTKSFVVGGFLAALWLPGSVSAQTVTLKMAHQWPQSEADYVVATGIRFAQEVEKRSDGQMKIQTFPAESLVKASATHTALKNGTVDLAIYPYIYAAGAIPEMNLVMMSGFWKSHDDVYRYRTSPVWKKLEAKVEAYGFKTLCWIQIAAGVASTKKFIYAPSDLQGQKTRMPGKYLEYASQKMGATNATMPSSELYSAMQLGLVDVISTSSSSFAAFRLYEVGKYYVSPEDYSMFFTIEPIAISMKTWNKLTPAQQQILTEVGSSLEQAALDGAKKEDLRVAKLFAEKGAKVEKLSLADWNRWQELSREYAFPKFRQDVPASAALLDESIEFYR